MSDIEDRIRERRKAIQDNAARIGINDAYISALVDRFYDKIRADAELGPIFNRAIGDDWDTHLPKMKQFWSSVTMNTGLYSGQPVPAHKKLSTVKKAHFERWLALFEQTLIETSPSPEAIDYFMERARRIAKSLQLAMFGIPSIPKP